MQVIRKQDLKKLRFTVMKSLDKQVPFIKQRQNHWHNANIIRNGKMSERTLATWRSKVLIGYVQIGGKIWYPREARKEFLSNHLIRINDGRKKKLYHTNK